MVTWETVLLEQAQPSKLDSGVFTWDISTDQFFADSAFALLFGLDPKDTMIGLPMERYIKRVHPDDVGRVAKSVHNAVVQGIPCQQNYRVRGANDQYSEIMAFGRCFRNPDGTPSQYAGIVYPVSPVILDGNNLHELCAQAHRAALRSGRLDIARSLHDILDDLAEKPLSLIREHAH